MAVVIVIAAAVITVAGLFLLVMGWRGRRIDDHPLCRRCGFDLSGKPADSAICSECGANLTPATIRIGHRVRRGKALAAGALLLLPGMLILAAAFAGANLNPYKPPFLLTFEAAYIDANRDAALAELTTRLGGTRLTQEQVDRVVRHALRIQADKARPWATKWGDFVENARSLRMVSDDQWQRYARQAAEGIIAIETRPRVCRGDPLPLWTAIGNARCGSGQKLFIQHRRRITLSGVPYDNPRIFGRDNDYLFAAGKVRSGMPMPLSPQLLAQLKDGPQTLDVDFEIEIGDNFTGKVIPDAAFVQRLSAPWELQSEPTVRMIKDPSRQERIASSLNISRLNFTMSSRQMLEISVQTTALEVGIGFDVFVRARGQEVNVGHFARTAGPRGHSFTFGTFARELGRSHAADPIASVDVIFRASPAAAAATIDVFEIWEGEITMKDVPFPTGR